MKYFCPTSTLSSGHLKQLCLVDPCPQRALVQTAQEQKHLAILHMSRVFVRCKGVIFQQVKTRSVLKIDRNVVELYAFLFLLDWKANTFSIVVSANFAKSPSYGWLQSWPWFRAFDLRQSIQYWFASSITTHTVTKSFYRGIKKINEGFTIPWFLLQNCLWGFLFLMCNRSFHDVTMQQSIHAQ